MNNQEIVNSWLRKLAESASGNHFSLDNQGQCILISLDNYQHGIYVPKDDDNLYLTSEIMEMPLDNREEILLRALSANLFQKETGGAAISYDPTTNYLVLSYTRQIESMDYAQFENIFDNLSRISQDIRHSLEQLQHQNGIQQPNSLNIEHCIAV